MARLVTYVGERDSGDYGALFVEVRDDSNAPRRMVLKHVGHHSPTGMEWGSSGRRRPSFPVVVLDVAIRAEKLESLGVRSDFTDRSSPFSLRVPVILLGRVDVVKVEGGLAPRVPTLLAAASSAEKLLEKGSLCSFPVPPSTLLTWAAQPFPSLIALVSEGMGAVGAEALSLQVDVGAFVGSGATNLSAFYALSYANKALSTEAGLVPFADWATTSVACHMDMIPEKWFRPGDGGPADLANSILSHAMDVKGVSAQLYQSFKADVICALPEAGFRLDQSAVMVWLNKRWSEMDDADIKRDLVPA